MSDKQSPNGEAGDMDQPVAVYRGGYDFIHMNEHGQVETGEVIIRDASGPGEHMSLFVHRSGERHHFETQSTKIQSIHRDPDGLLNVITESGSLYVLIPQPIKPAKPPRVTAIGNYSSSLTGKIKKLFGLS